MLSKKEHDEKCHENFMSMASEYTQMVKIQHVAFRNIYRLRLNLIKFN